MAFPSIRFNSLTHITENLPRSRRFATGATRSRDYYAEGETKERSNSGDEWAAQVKAQKPKGPAKRPCNIPASEWPICHQRCYHRPHCGAALAADLQFNIWGL